MYSNETSRNNIRIKQLLNLSFINVIRKRTETHFEEYGNSCSHINLVLQ